MRAKDHGLTALELATGIGGVRVTERARIILDAGGWSIQRRRTDEEVEAVRRYFGDVPPEDDEYLRWEPVASQVIDRETAVRMALVV